MSTIQDFFTSIPDLRNGAAATYNMVHVASGIPTHYYTYDPADIPVAKASIRLRLRLVAAHYAKRLEDSGLAAEVARAQGCCLACVREGLYTSWLITTTDLIAAQKIDVATDAIAWNSTLVGENRVTDAATKAHFVAITGDYLPDDLIAKLARVGMGMLSCTGVVLVRTEDEHHFAEPHKNVHRAVLNQVMGPNYAPPFGLDHADFEDVVCHKAAHCIVTSVATTMARRVETKVRLRSAKVAAAAVRVPALYPAEAAASAMSKVAHTASALGQVANVNVDVGAIVIMVKAVSSHDMSKPEGRAAAADSQQHLVDTHCEDIAFCGGMIKASCAHAGQVEPPILNARSVKNIMNDCTASVTRGVAQMEQAFAVQRSRARRGILPGVGVFGAERPADTDPLPADDTIAQILSAVLGAKADGTPSAPVP